jgi:hypothetical protein
MKRGYLFTALLFAVFMFPFIGNVSNADALGNYGCGNKDKRTHVNCLRGLLSNTPYGIGVKANKPGRDGLGNYGCGNKNKKKHTKCLRRLLDQHAGGPGMPPMGNSSGMPTVGNGSRVPPTEIDRGCTPSHPKRGPRESGRCILRGIAGKMIECCE